MKKTVILISLIVMIGLPVGQAVAAEPQAVAVEPQAEAVVAKAKNGDRLAKPQAAGGQKAAALVPPAKHNVLKVIGYSLLVGLFAMLALEMTIHICRRRRTRGFRRLAHQLVELTGYMLILVSMLID